VHDEVVGSGLGIDRAGLAEGGSHAVDKDDISKFARHTPNYYSPVTMAAGQLTVTPETHSKPALPRSIYA
jgi:hypothetical protein